MRWTVRLDANAAAEYAASVVPIVPTVEARLSKAVVANRVEAVSPNPPAIFLEPWPQARDRFREAVSALAAGSEAVAITDVRACYPSITPGAIEECLRRLGCAQVEVANVLDGLRRFEDAGVAGLPVGPEPSALLANAVLSHLDITLEAARHRHVRWVDDVMVFLRHGSEADHVLELTRTALAAVGLELAEEKTRIVLHPDHPGEEARACLSPADDASDHTGR